MERWRRNYNERRKRNEMNVEENKKKGKKKRGMSEGERCHQLINVVFLFPSALCFKVIRFFLIILALLPFINQYLLLATSLCLRPSLFFFFFSFSVSKREREREETHTHTHNEVIHLSNQRGGSPEESKHPSLSLYLSVSRSLREHP